jgi:hypothetical protein
MALALAPPIVPKQRFFFGVERSSCGRAWRDRLDERGAQREPLRSRSATRNWAGDSTRHGKAIAWRSDRP